MNHFIKLLLISTLSQSSYCVNYSNSNPYYYIIRNNFIRSNIDNFKKISMLRKESKDHFFNLLTLVKFKINMLSFHYYSLSDEEKCLIENITSVLY